MEKSKSQWITVDGSAMQAIKWCFELPSSGQTDGGRIFPSQKWGALAELRRYSRRLFNTETLKIIRKNNTSKLAGL